MVAKWLSHRAHNPKVRGSIPRYALYFFHRDSMAEWIRRLTTDQEIQVQVLVESFFKKRFRNSVPHVYAIPFIHIYQFTFTYSLVTNFRVLSERHLEFLIDN